LLILAQTKNKKLNYIPERPITRNLSEEEWQALIEKDKAYSKIVCRCEKITEGEILSVLNSPLPPKSLDALKRRVRTGMGRCQGGFCSSKIMDIVSKFYGISINSVTKSGKGSEIILSDIKPTFEGENNERI
jgi:BFD-like [2Fe-2S] binding domain.